MPHKIDVEGTPWNELATGARFQKWSANGMRLRVLEVRPEFVELDWCPKGHIIHVCSGELEFDFQGHVERFAVGDTIVIPAGDGHKARALTSVVRLLVVDEVELASTPAAAIETAQIH